MKLHRFVLAGLLSLSVSASLAAQTFHDPLPYLSRSDGPFQDYIYFENFEDQLLNVSGVSADNGFKTSTSFSTLIDSVDADDGNIDGSEGLGDSYFYASAAVGITFTFDPVVLGGYPLPAGLVWTDGSGTTTFEAFDASGLSQGTVGPVALGIDVPNLVAFAGRSACTQAASLTPGAGVRLTKSLDLVLGTY